MNTAVLWRVGEQRADRVLAAFLFSVSGALVLAMHLGDLLDSVGSRDLYGPVAQFAALFLAFRFAFAGGRVWMLAVDAKRAQLPVLPEGLMRTEALRVLHFIVLPALPFALVGAWTTASLILAGALAGVSVGILSSVVPYRFFVVLVGGVLALQIGNQSGILSWSPASALVGAAALFAFCGLYVRRRVAAMAAAPRGAEVGPDYSMAQAIGRHAGSIWSAPDTSPMAAMSAARRPGDSPRSPVALLGEPIASRLAEPGRAVRDWALTLGLFPVLMSGFFAVLAALDGASLAAVQRVVMVVWPGLVLTWVPMAAVVFLWLGTFRPARERLRPGHPVHDALHLLPGMPVGRAAWRQLLRPVAWPPLAVGVLLVLSAIPLIPPGPMLMVPVTAAALMAALVFVQADIAVSTRPSAPRWGYLAAGLSGLLLIALAVVTSISSFRAALAAG